MLMRNFTLIALCVALAVPAGQASLRDKVNHGKQVVVAKKARKNAPRNFSARAAEAAALWCATTQKAYGWDGEDWSLEETYAIQYDNQGRKTQQDVTDVEGYVNREVYTWNAEGMLATRLSTVAESADGEFENNSKLARSYDSRVPSFITANEQYTWNGSAWAESNYYTQTVTRNADGNVTGMERAVYFQGVIDPTYRLTVTYGADGKAATIHESDLTYDYSTGEYGWSQGSLISDIVWENTDGQILSTEELFTGANRIKSATITDLEFEMDYHYTAEYNADGSYTVTMTIHDDEYDEDMQSEIIYTPTDANGSYTTETTTTYIDADGPYYSESMQETYRYDAYGLILLEEVLYEGEVEGRIEGTVEYDSENGYPLCWTLQEFDYDTEEMVNTFRAEYGDYINAGVADVVVDAEAPVQYFNLQGIRINEPVAGQVVIRRQGNKATKVFVK